MGFLKQKFNMLLLILCAVLLLLQSMTAANRYVYHDYAGMTKYLLNLAKDHAEIVQLNSQGETLGKRDLWCLTICSGEPDNKPALLIIGGVEGPDLIGSELCLQFITMLVAQYGQVDSITQMLKRTAIYVFPRINPDAAEAFFTSPRYERNLNGRPTDLDKDGYRDEDGYEDLNNDGLISIMRITDPAGEWLPDPEIPELLIKADRAKGQKGVFRIYTEGVDNDKDGQWNEDEPGGVNFNQNFSYNYQFFTKGSGNYQMSEMESNGLAQFAFAHPNIAAVFCFSPNDNLSHPWQIQQDEKNGNTSQSAQPEKPLTCVRANDAPYFNQVAERFKKITAFSDAPEISKGEGAFSEWAYYHYGRWSFSIPAWWPPKIGEPAASSKTDTTQLQKSNEQQNSVMAGESDRIAGQRRTWQWLAATGQTNNFVAWKEISHPDFPDNKVEIGGFAPFTGINPPPDSIQTRSQKYSKFLLHLMSLLPQITISKINVESLHENIFRLHLYIANNGFLPTNTDLGVYSKWNPKVKISIGLEKGQQLLDNKSINLIDTIAGSGGTVERSWVVMGRKGSRITIHVSSPTAGSDETSVVLE